MLISRLMLQTWGHPVPLNSRPVLTLLREAGLGSVCRIGTIHKRSCQNGLYKSIEFNKLPLNGCDGPHCSRGQHDSTTAHSYPAEGRLAQRTLAALMIVSGIAPNAVRANASPKASVKPYKLDGEISKRKNANPQGITSVIVTMVPGATLPPQFKKFARGNKLQIINGQVLDVPNGILKQLEASPQIFQVHFNRPIGKDNYRTTVTVGSRTVNEQLGYTGAGVGIAVIDSGISAWHDDLTQGSGSTIYPYGNQRVKKFVDFVNGRTLPYDDNGHGTHVSGIIAGNGYDSRGEKSGVAPNASLVSLKVLDGNGSGTISNIIAAFDGLSPTTRPQHPRHQSSVGEITESYLTDRSRWPRSRWSTGRRRPRRQLGKNAAGNSRSADREAAVRGC